MNKRNQTTNGYGDLFAERERYAKQVQQEAERRKQSLANEAQQKQKDFKRMYPGL